MAWNASLQLDYSLAAYALAQSNGEDKTIARFNHTGPLRILQSLYPEGDAICHNVIVHPPGGLVGGDTLAVNITLASGAHALVTTPGATRFYRSDGDAAVQKTTITVAENARMEWLPLESIAYSGCLAENRLRLELAPGGELVGWDVTALGLPAANQPFVAGSFSQHIELPGVWLERARIRASDDLLLNSQLGLAGQRCVGTLFFVTGQELERNRRQDALDAARAVIAEHPMANNAGATSPDRRVVVVRVVAPVVEPVLNLLKQVRRAWRQQLWGMQSEAPRVWAT